MDKAKSEDRGPMGLEGRGDHRHGGSQHLGPLIRLPQLAPEKTYSTHRRITESLSDRRDDRADVPAKRPAALDRPGRAHSARTVQREAPALCLAIYGGSWRFSSAGCTQTELLRSGHVGP